MFVLMRKLCAQKHHPLKNNGLGWGFEIAENAKKCNAIRKEDHRGPE